MSLSVSVTARICKPSLARFLVLLLFILMCSACGANATTSTGGTNLDFPGYWHLVVTQVPSAATAQDNSNLQAGNRFIALQVTATNIQQSDPTGAGSQIDVSDFNLYDASGNGMPHETLYDIHNAYNFPGGIIRPGETGTVIMYYQVPTQAGTYELDFQLHAVNTGTHVHCDITVPSGN